MTVVFANVAAPGLSVAGLFPLWVLVPIVLIEWGVYAWRHTGSWLVRVLLANVVSSLAGVPIAAVVMFSVPWEPRVVSFAVFMSVMYVASVLIEHGVIMLLSRSASGDRARWSTAWLASGATYAGLTGFTMVMLALR